MFGFTLSHHPVPVRSPLNCRLGPDGYAIREARRGSEMFLVTGIQAGLGAR